jgi:hypothetical protein
MSIPKLFTRLAVFCCTLLIALFVTRFFLIPPRVVVVADTPDSQTSAPINFKVLLVTIDRGQAKTYTQVTVERNAHAPAPARLWVWTYFYTPRHGFAWRAEPVAVPAPFTAGDRTTLTVAAPCGDCGTPSENYYAYVQVSAEQPGAGYEFGAQRGFDIQMATPVVVAHELRR